MCYGMEVSYDFVDEVKGVQLPSPPPPTDVPFQSPDTISMNKRERSAPNTPERQSIQKHEVANKASPLKVVLDSGSKLLSPFRLFGSTNQQTSLQDISYYGRATTDTTPPSPGNRSGQSREGLSSRLALLFRAAEAGDLTSLQKLIEAGLASGTPYSLSERDESTGCTVLHIACLAGNSRVVEYLLQHGADLRAYTILHASPLHFAAYKGRDRAAKVLLNHAKKIFSESEWSPDVRDEHGCTPLHVAASNGHAKMIDVLVQFNSKISIGNFVGATALHYATCSGHETSVRRLLRRKADPNETDQHKCTPLHCAAFYGHVSVARILLAHGADRLAQDKAGKTPLEISRIADNSEIFVLLSGISSDGSASTQASDDEGEEENAPDLFEFSCVSNGKEASELARALKLNRTVKVLDLKGSNFGSTGLSALASALKSNKSVRTLNLSGTITSAADMSIVCQALCVNVTLQNLDLSDSRPGTSGMKSLANVLAKNSTILKLKLCSTITNASEANEFSIGLASNKSIVDLDISYSRFRTLMSSNGMKFIANALIDNRRLSLFRIAHSINGLDEAMEFVSIMEAGLPLILLDIRGNDFDNAQIDLVDALRKCRSLQHLYADTAILSDVDKAKRIYECIKGIKVDLTTVNLEACITTKEQTADFLDALDESNCVTSVNVSACRLGSPGLVRLLYIAAKSVVLASLNINGCLKTELEAEALAHCIRNTNTISSLSLRDCHFSEETIETLILPALIDNESIAKLRVEPEHSRLLPLIYVNEGVQRLDTASAEDVQDLLFETIRVGKVKMIPRLLQAGADPAQRDTRSGCLPHTLALQQSLAGDALITLFRAHWEIDEHFCGLLELDKNMSVFQLTTITLAQEGWQSPQKETVLHAVLSACEASLLSSVRALQICEMLRENKPDIFSSVDSFGRTPAHIAVQCTQEYIDLQKLLLPEILALARTASPQGPASIPFTQTSSQVIECKDGRQSAITVFDESTSAEHNHTEKESVEIATDETLQSNSLESNLQLLSVDNSTALSENRDKKSAARRLFPGSLETEKTSETCVGSNGEDDDVRGRPDAGNEATEREETVRVVAEEFKYDGEVYFLEPDTGKVYERHGDNDFVGKLINGIIDFNAIDSDIEETEESSDEGES
eukprot:m.132223 g.132223  ORF g.132223 m.132223 type:complete len:1145 (-) comp14642_c1_seq2:276-3710(-)